MESLDKALQSPDALKSLKVFDLKAIGRTTHLLVKMRPKPDFRSFDVESSLRSGTGRKNRSSLGAK